MPAPEFELTVRVAGNSGVVADEVIDNSPNEKLVNANAHHILLLVHGYNNSYDDAKASYKTFIDNLNKALDPDSRAAPDAIAKFYWPGDESTILGTTFGYPFDINHARDAADRLVAYLVTLPVPTLRLTVVGHSMGCRLILEALGRFVATTPNIAVVGLMAAASPVDFVRSGARLFNTGRPPRRMVKFFSLVDDVLHYAFPLGQWVAYQYQIEDNNYSEAIGRFGNPSEFGTGQQTNNRHSAYWSDGTIVSKILQQVDATIPQPVDSRQPAVRSLTPPAQLGSRVLPTRSLPTR